MLPVIALVGRTNVGKSTLFNALTRSKAALVADYPGLTRDRQYGLAQFNNSDYWVIDTGGIVLDSNQNIDQLLKQQVDAAMQEADLIYFLCDAQEGLTVDDQDLMKQLRVRYAEKLVVVVNKTDRENKEMMLSDFYCLGASDLFAIAAKTTRGIDALLEKTLQPLLFTEEVETHMEATDAIRLTLLGRPNVGKSTLVNALLGEARVVVSDEAGTTRDSVEIDFQYKQREYCLIDTAGIRRRSRVQGKIEKFSIIKTLQALSVSDVVLCLFDAQEDVTDQDLKLMGKVIELGKAMVILFNKWDGLDTYQKQQFKDKVDRRLQFAQFARRYYISALHGTGLGQCMRAVTEAYDCSRIKVSTHELTALLEKAQYQHQPPLVRGRRVKLRYAHLGEHNPLTIVIHGKQTKSLPGSYTRYLTNFFIDQLHLVGVPLRLAFKTDDNPYQ